MECKQLWRMPPLRRIINAVVCLNTTSCVSYRTRMPCPKQGLQLQPGSWSKDMFKQGYGWPNSSCFMCLRNKLSWLETTEIWGSFVTTAELITTHTHFLPHILPLGHSWQLALSGAFQPAFEPWATSLRMQCATSLRGCFLGWWRHQLSLIIPSPTWNSADYLLIKYFSYM